jgi:hypothetical protein
MDWKDVPEADRERWIAMLETQGRMAANGQEPSPVWVAAVAALRNMPADAEVGRLLREARERWPRWRLVIRTSLRGTATVIVMDDGDSIRDAREGASDAAALRALLGET